MKTPKAKTANKTLKTSTAKEFIQNYHKRVAPILNKYPRKAPVPIEKMSMFA